MLRHSPTLRTPPPDIRIGSLFSGYGGLDAAALHILGEHARITWHSDIKPASVALLAARDPGVPNLGDIHGIDAPAPPVDALTFGWPCQPHSSAGKRLGEADPRALWPEVARIIAALRPKYLFGENVARVASNGELARVTRTLAHLGYVGTYRTLRASDVGAPHRRDRLFLYAVDAAADTEHPQQQRGRPAQWPVERPGPADRGSAAGLTLLPTPSVRDSTRGEGWGHQPGRPLSETIHRVAEQWGAYAGAIARWERIVGREAPEPTMPTARSAAVLSPRFVEWMMGLPPDWVDLPELSRSQQLSLLGDGVVPQQAIAAFTELTARMVSRETERAS